MEISLDALQGFWKQIRSFKTTCFKKFFEIQKSFDNWYDLWHYLNIKAPSWIIWPYKTLKYCQKLYDSQNCGFASNKTVKNSTLFYPTLHGIGVSVLGSFTGSREFESCLPLTLSLVRLMAGNEDQRNFFNSYNKIRL